MTVHRRSYRPFEGARRPRSRLFLTIARHELRLAFRKSWVKRLLWLGALPMVFASMMIYVAVVIEQTLQIDMSEAQYFRSMYDAQMLFVVLMMTAAGSDLVAKDAASSAHQLYFSRPLSRAQYMFGKVTAVGVLLFALIVVPGWILALVQWVLIPDSDAGAFFQKLGELTIYGVVLSVCAGALITCFSAYGQRARYVGLAWVGLYFFSIGASAALMSGPHGSTDPSSFAHLVSFQTLFRESGYLMYAADKPTSGPLVILLVVGAVSLLALYRRIRHLERGEK